MSELEKRFEAWWREEYAPLLKSGIAGGVKTICRIAWVNGAYVQADLLMDAEAKEEG